MPDYETYEHDVLVIGTGGAGLRAAIEASAAGVSVGMVCKCLLGKAHTVMAEGGIAAALANVDDRDNWKVHFADTMRGGQYVNNWRMAELHAKEAPDRVRELEAWGAVFDRTKDGRILQRNFGGHKYPRLGARRRSHRPGDDPHPARPRGSSGNRRSHGGLCPRSAEGWSARQRSLWLRSRARPFPDFSREGHHPGHRRHRQSAYKITSNSWDCTGDGHALAYHAGAELIDMEYLQFHPTGMVWPPSVRGMLVTEGVRGEGGILTNKEGKRFMFDFIPDNYKAQTADNEEEGWRYTQGDKNARRPPELAHARPRGALHRARDQGRARQPARRRVPRHFVDQETAAQRGGTHQAQAAEHVSPVQTTGRRRHHARSRWRSGRPRITSWAECGSMPTRRCRMCPGFLRRANAPRASTARIGWAAIRFPIFWFSENGRASSPPNSPRRIR